MHANGAVKLVHATMTSIEARPVRQELGDGVLEVLEDGRMGIMKSPQVMLALLHPDAAGDTRCTKNDKRKWRCAGTKVEGSRFCSRHGKQPGGNMKVQFMKKFLGGTDANANGIGNGARPDQEGSGSGSGNGDSLKKLLGGADANANVAVLDAGVSGSGSGDSLKKLLGGGGANANANGAVPDAGGSGSGGGSGGTGEMRVASPDGVASSRDDQTALGPATLPSSTGHAAPELELRELKQMLQLKLAESTTRVDEMEKKMEQHRAQLEAALERDNCTSQSKDIVPKAHKKGAVVKVDMAQVQKRNQTLMRQFGVIFNKICKHEWAWPFMEPVDTVGLGLHDYFDVIAHPMDLGTIKKRIDEGFYCNVKEMCKDMRLVFANAIKYNQSDTDIYFMAIKLSSKFEDWWFPLASKVQEPEQDIQQLEGVKSAKGAMAIAEKLSNSVLSQIEDLEKELVHLKQQALSRKRPMDLPEKQQLGQRLQHLPPQIYERALRIIEKQVPAAVKTRGDEVDVDFTALDSATLWRLHYFVRVNFTPDPHNSGDAARNQCN